MSSDRPKKPRLRGKAKARKMPYPLSEFSNDAIVCIGRSIVHRLAVGHSDITGDDFGGIFAEAISGVHREKPLGVTDVIWNECSWSVKTVKANKPFEQKNVRLITGRNSPDFSYGIEKVRENVNKTGSAVLNIWNERVNQSFEEYIDLRVVVLVRNMETLEFTLFEYEAGRYAPADYEWRLNPHRNFQGYEKGTNNHCFTWQPHGSQFTVIKKIPGSACKFRIKKRPGLIEPQQVLMLVRFDESWIERIE